MSEELVIKLKDQIKAFKENPASVRDTVVATAKEMMIKENGEREPVLDEDPDKLVDFIVESLRNHAIKRVGKSKFQFSPHMMGLLN